MSFFDLQPYRNLRVCVALSGGADSVCLLDCFRCGAKDYGISLSAAHVEHGIRGEESLRDMNFCEKLCKDFDVPLKIFKRDIPALAKELKIGLEEAARQARYEIFLSLIEEGEVDLIATAHHADDVAETLLFRLARGTSPSGMKPILNYGGIVRPLLSVERSRISAYLRERELPFVEDSTNSDETYTRNFIRSSVLPAFEKINENAKEHLLQFADLCARDDEYLARLAKKEIVRFGKDLLVPLSLPDPLFFRACLMCIDAEKDYTGALLREISKLRTLQSGKKISLPGGQFAAREYENVVFYYPEEPPRETPFREEDFSDPSRGLRADLDAFPAGCVVRSRREGDFIVPFGGRKKSLKKFFTDKKISSRLGGKIPLVAFGEEILVVCGVEISDKVKVTESTTRVGFF